MKILVTGCCGFIGYNVCLRLLEDGNYVIGIDNFDNYYDVNVKRLKCDSLKSYENFVFSEDDIITTDIIERLKPEKICHLASKAGVRNSILDPKSYVRNNIEGFINLVEQAVKTDVETFVYASSSSVYGLNEKIPFSESDNIDSCNSPYAASKRSMEIFANTYNQLYGLSFIGLRFFTVYGPGGRPDMAPYKFLKSIIMGEKFEKFGNGESMRDYTYIDDIVDGVILSLENKNNVKCDVFNLGNSSPISLNNFISLIEKISGKKALYDQIGDQLGDVPITCADISKAKRELGYNPKISLEEGLLRTYNWMISHFKIENIFNS